MKKRKIFVIDENIFEIKSDHNEIRIPTPTSTLIKSYLDVWNANEAYIVQDKALNKIFSSPLQNIDLSDILIKVTILNTFYSTQIYSVFPVAQHISNIQDMDNRVQQGDETLIDEFREIALGGKIRNLYSFATKYCHFHNGHDFPIYDSYIDALLRIFRDAGCLPKFKNDELREYPRYKEILHHFRTFYNFAQYTTKELDIFLWQFGYDIIKAKQALV